MGIGFSKPLEEIFGVCGCGRNHKRRTYSSFYPHAQKQLPAFRQLKCWLQDLGQGFLQGFPGLHYCVFVFR